MTAPSPDAVGDLVCSAKGCRAEATWALLWNNPRLHTPDRRKVWLACDEHREHLTSFLDLRGFLKDTVPASEVPTVEAGPTDVLGGGFDARG
ncbi:hypothetical protein [Luteimicrobium subarcticum]|uniref:Acetone carboxylase n=1 Tax=Luteimicrobium subarcticum TaxID=620910 RepID=A0A2M8WWG1_9MICO|nr:hypothetical protein [Luteimicrobium subarcticum]PJI95257.1 hypothetical protein CLV34_0020 [Luteimicrobium subarcticum]